MTITKLRNGMRVKQPKFPFFQGTVQWVWDDEWMLMSEPYRTTDGDLAVMPHGDADGKITYSGEELLARLKSSHYELTPQRPEPMSIDTQALYDKDAFEMDQRLGDVPTMKATERQRALDECAALCREIMSQEDAYARQAGNPDIYLHALRWSRYGTAKQILERIAALPSE